MQTRELETKAIMATGREALAYVVYELGDWRLRIEDTSYNMKTLNFLKLKESNSIKNFRELQDEILKKGLK